ncbi:MAG: hypothetical protein MUE53_00495 [Chitinophagales bacterium]|jgi:hypothetical protein|nr:hypothetical protein [Chitinophagales bacterium]
MKSNVAVFFAFVFSIFLVDGIAQRRPNPNRMFESFEATHEKTHVIVNAKPIELGKRYMIPDYIESLGIKSKSETIKGSLMKSSYNYFYFDKNMNPNDSKQIEEFVCYERSEYMEEFKVMYDLLVWMDSTWMHFENGYFELNDDRLYHMTLEEMKGKYPKDLKEIIKKYEFPVHFFTFPMSAYSIQGQESKNIKLDFVGGNINFILIPQDIAEKLKSILENR